MAENISPEERLFKVIQQGKNSAPEEGKPGGKKFGEWLRGLKRFISAVGAPPSGEKKGFNWKTIIPANLKLPELEPGVINKVLAAALIIVAILVIYALTSKRQDTTMITDAVSKIQIASVGGNEKIEPLKKADFYLAEIRKRDIFHPIPKEAVTETKQGASGKLKKAAESLKLQGISWGPAPKAMILWQNDKEGNMYFLTKGQTIGSTGIKIKEIRKDKVVIGNDEEEMDLL
ncbi:MAG: hypothetical protein NTY76_01895 [Candidatus Omnitrophica bacterium]|nr:hypothetical protein [Candidatus Omnitrophota bacterium]